MNPLEEHQQAMNFSFLAKQAREEGKEDVALNYYQKAADIEGIVADYYFNEPELEPTRSIIIRSAAFLFLKAGDIQHAKKYVFWGVVNASDELMQEQFYEALEIVVAYAKLKPEDISRNIDYIYRLRQKSQTYILEPTLYEHSNAVTLEMVSDFSSNFIKSLKAFSISQFKDLNGEKYPSEEELNLAATKFQSNVKPLLTSAGFGSFKFSIATDFIPRLGEDSMYSTLRSNILIQYHENVFSKELTDENIESFKQHFTDDEIEQIFRPVFHIRSPKAEYKVAYVDRENLKKVFLPRTKNSQRVKLLPTKTIDKEDIGFLESLVTHTRSTTKGGLQKHVILKEQLSKWSLDKRTKMISSSTRDPFFLNAEIIINVSFDSTVGFVFSYEELPIEAISITFEGAETEFYNAFILVVREIVNQSERTVEEETYYQVIKRLINNPEMI